MENLVVTFFTSRTLETELEENTNSVVPYFGLTVGIMLVFCLISVTMGDCVRSKTLLGLAGILCAGLSCIAAFGLLIYIGVPFIGINMAAPFLMLGEYSKMPVICLRNSLTLHTYYIYKYIYCMYIIYISTV